MSLNLNFSLTTDNSTGQTEFFVDTTIDYGVSGNPDYSDVKQTRFLAANWPAQENPNILVAGDSLVKYTQYQLTSTGPSVYDNKTLVLGSYFIPFIDGLTIASGDTFVTTGAYSAYVSPSDYLPTSGHNVFNMGNSYWGLETQDNVFSSMVYSLQYEIYGDTTPDPLTNVANETQYIVTGTGSDTAIWNGNTYRVGEVFITTNTGVVTFTGTGNLKILLASKNRYYSIFYTLQNRYGLLILSQNCCGSINNPLMNMILVELYGLNWGNLTEWVSISKSTETMNWISQQLSILELQ